MSAVETLFERAALRWDDYEGLEESTLLRLAILRDLMREIHAERSRCLAEGKKADAQAFRDREKAIEDLRKVSPLSGKLPDCLARSSQAKARTRLLPEALFGFLAREKLERYDRAWEATLAAEAAALGWCFWALEAWVDIQQVEKWQEALTGQLIPHGVILFAENSETQAPSDVESGGPVLWHGRWYIVLKSQFRTPHFNVERLPGVSKDPELPQWRMLFSPKRR